ncbi:hypothetical protein MYAM1_002057 [Malassezia yamatoensis]|uniref:Symplekin n=1 Tax=Malassezia yamatoensis TaxID=253288 RepID=A0AAJ6CHZ1_9BASI|nr:hypothetical protein MYAM1_002057 [Malassezia yamatoensis]
MDPIAALCTSLAQATGGTYAIDLNTPEGINNLAEVVDLIFCKRIVSPEVREKGRYFTLILVAVHVPAALLLLLSEPSERHAKLACECFASVYPRVVAAVYVGERLTNRLADSNQSLWQLTCALKQRIDHLLEHGKQGARIGAIKAIQRLILVQTRANLDPRLANREIHLGSIPSNHPFLRPNELESEANQSFTKLITLLFTASVPNVVMAVVSVLTRLARARPALGKVVIEAYVSWTPAALTGVAYVNVRSVENTVRLAMIHFLHHGSTEPHTSQLTHALEAQRRRMDAALRAFHSANREAQRKREAQRSSGEDSHRDLPETSAKRQKSQARQSEPRGPSAADIARLPVDRVVDAIIVGLQSMPEARLKAAIGAFLQSDAQRQPMDPLKMDVGDEDLARLAPAIDAKNPRTDTQDPDFDDEETRVPNASLEHFELPAPAPLEQREAQALIIDSVSRICAQGTQLSRQGVASISEGHAALWISLITRLATRGLDTSIHPGKPIKAPPALAEQAHRVRTLLLEFVTEDFAQRRPIAQQWLAEEWTCDRKRQKQGVSDSHYEPWLDRVLESQLREPIDEATLHSFLEELPELPESVLDRLYTLCLDKATLTQGFALLRDISAARPPLRTAVCDKVLQLTRHEQRLIRGKAIVTARPWVLQKGPLTDRVLEFAKNSLQLLKQAGAEQLDEAAESGQDAERSLQEDGAASAPLLDAPSNAVETKVDTSKPSSSDEEAAKKAAFEATDQDVLRLMELALVLSVKQPSIFTEVVEIYPGVTTAVQAAINKHITPVARAVGPNNTALLDVLRHAPRDADPLVHAMVRILIDKGHTRSLASLVLYLVEERNLSTDLLLPLLPELQREDAIRALPRVVQLLRDPTEENETTLSSVFRTLVAPPPPATATLSPVDLLVLLHIQGEEIGIKLAVAATQLCFAMTDIFRNEVMMAVLNRLVEEDKIPVLFMRTAIMAIKSFRSLASYVSTSLLSKLVRREIWHEPRLWDGFALCASLTAPTSFGALLQLPQEQLQQIMQKQPTIREPLRDYLIYKAGGPARHAALLQMLDPTATTATPQDT